MTKVGEEITIIALRQGVENKAERVKIVISHKIIKTETKAQGPAVGFFSCKPLHPCYQQIWNQPPSLACKEGGERNEEGITKLVLLHA